MDANTMRAQLIARVRGTNSDLLNIDDREASDVLSRAQLEFVMRRAVGDLNVKQKGFEIDKKRRIDLSGLITPSLTFKRVQSGRPGDFILGTEDNGALRTPDLDYQMESTGTTGATIETGYGIFCRIPNECLFIITETCNTSKGTQVKRGVPVETVTYEEYNTLIRHPYQSPYYNKVWRMDSGNWSPADFSSGDLSSKGITGINADGSELPASIANTVDASVHLIPGKDWIIDAYRINYIKRPRRIVVDVITPSNQVSCELGSAIHNEIVDEAVRLLISSRIPEQSKYQVAEKESREHE